MLAPLSYADALGVLKSHVDSRWLEAYMATPDGAAHMNALIDMFVAVDAKDALDWSALFVVTSSGQVAPPATGAQYATTTIQITRRRAGYSLVIPAGTRCQTPDGHTYLTDNALAFATNELVSKATTATALVAGFPGIIPPGEITQFTKIANGLNGVGVGVTLANATSGSQPKSLLFQADATQPSPFRYQTIGLYLEMLTGPNAGRAVSIAAVNDGGFLANPTLPESVWAWSPALTTTVDVSYLAWTTGAAAYTWVVRDWDDLGFAVTNTTPVVGGRAPTLDELAKSRGRPRLPGEGDGPLAARLARQPQPPTPLGLLRKAVIALKPYNASRHDVKVYELREPGPDAVDNYGENFPAGGGFVLDLHSTDMSSPLTPTAMASKSPAYATLSPVFDPGLAVPVPTVPFAVATRWDPPGGLSVATVAAARVALQAALKNGKQPGCLSVIYYPPAWAFVSYP